MEFIHYFNEKLTLTQDQQEFVKNTQIMVDSVRLKQAQMDVFCAKQERKSSIYEGLLWATLVAAEVAVVALLLLRKQLKDAGKWIARQFRKKETPN